MEGRRRSAEEQHRNYGGGYQRYRAAVLASRPRCVLRLPGCTFVATTLDHQPPLALHDHRGFGAGCCRTVPACASCNARSGGWLVVRRRRQMARARSGFLVVGRKPSSSVVALAGSRATARSRRGRAPPSFGAAAGCRRVRDRAGSTPDGEEACAHEQWCSWSSQPRAVMAVAAGVSPASARRCDDLRLHRVATDVRDAKVTVPFSIGVTGLTPKRRPSST